MSSTASPSLAIDDVSTGPAAGSSSAPVGVFDSGVGGLSVLAAVTALLPTTPMVYVADSGHAPYGDRHDDHATRRTLRISRYLVDRGAGLLVIACNTATAAAIGLVREQWPQLAVVGVEPGVKPAVLQSRNGRIGVMATPATLRSDRFVALMQRHAADRHLVLQPCPGLARAIESGDVTPAETHALMDSFCRPLREAGVDTVVLGCTHYAFVKPQLQALLGPAVAIIDTAEAVAREAARRHATVRGTNVMEEASRVHAWSSSNRPVPSGAGSLELLTTGDARQLTDFAQRWLALSVTATALPDL